MKFVSAVFLYRAYCIRTAMRHITKANKNEYIGWRKNFTVIADDAQQTLSYL